MKRLKILIWLIVWIAGGAFGTAHAAESLKIGWTNYFLYVTAPWLPGDYVKINYLEAFCRSGSSHRDWKETVIPHKTQLVSADANGTKLELRTKVEPSVEIVHKIEAHADEVEFNLEIKNNGNEFVDVQWFQPCIRVDRFTGLQQSNYFTRCFIYTESGLKMMDKLPQTVEARYRGGQVYVPKGINTNDVNPRPISLIRPVNGLIGCFSKDNKYILANAWSETQELFQGVVVCVHNDPRIVGLKPLETKKLRGKVYILKNDTALLAQRYGRDFPLGR